MTLVRRVRDQNGEATIICSLNTKQADCVSWLNTIISYENLSDCSVKTIAACRGVEFPATVIIMDNNLIIFLIVRCTTRVKGCNFLAGLSQVSHMFLQ